MAKLPPIRKLRIEDYPNADANFQKLIGNINQFMESTYNAMSKNMSVTENLKASYQTLTSITDGNYPITFTPTTANPASIMVTQITDVDSKGTPTGTTISNGVSIDWLMSGSNVAINKITGLTAGRTYNLKLLLMG